MLCTLISDGSIYSPPARQSLGNRRNPAIIQSLTNPLSLLPSSLHTRYNRCRRCVISHIIIDGYNVIGIFHKDMEKARNALLSQLAAYRKGKAHDITVVFDGYKNGMAIQQVSFFQNIKVIYTRLGERADDVIKKIVSQDRREWIVVTADREIVDHAWSAGSVPVLPDRFMAIVERSGKFSADEDMPQADEEDEEYESHGRKGNPYRLSKKEKALRRVISKL